MTTAVRYRNATAAVHPERHLRAGPDGPTGPAAESEAASPARLAPIRVCNPANGSLLGEVPAVSEAEARAALIRARAAAKDWARRPIPERARIVRQFAATLSAHAGDVARLISAESGKTLYEAHLFEIVSLMHLSGYFARRAAHILKPRRIRISVFKNRASYIHYKPRGVVLVIAPWNFPVSIPMGEVVMALLAGNAVLLKPASLTPLVALRMRELFTEAGLPADVFQVLPGPGRMASSLIEQGGIDYVNFTGSTEVGRRVAALCGEHLIPCSMELGGKDPAIVCADADLETAAQTVVWGAFANSGQICASVERAYVARPVFDAFVDRVVALTCDLKQGPPLSSADLDVGAMTDPQQVDVVEAQVRDAVARGARVLVGGRRAVHGPQFFEPTVLVDVEPQADVVREETFGPLLPILPFDDEDEAVRLANDSPYGLSAYVFSRDRKRAERIAERLEAGTVMINDVLATHAYPETPWGGVKASGIGRVHADDGLRDLSVAYHVNTEVVTLPNPARYPYSGRKVKQFLGLVRLVHGLGGLKGRLAALKGLFSTD